MRVFFSAWPSPEVVAQLTGLPRPEDEAVRWTAPASWHVTLEFVGEVGEGALPDLIGALDQAAARCGPRHAALGPAAVRLGSGQLVVPVAGVEDLAAAVSAATAAAGIDAREATRPFRGHLTIARGRGRRGVPAALAGTPIRAAWLVEEVTLVRSRLGAGGSIYEVLATAPLRPG